MPSTCLPIAEDCQGWSIMNKLLCKSILTIHDHLLVLLDFVSPFVEDFLYHLPRDWAEVNELEDPQNFLLAVPEEMNGTCFLNSHDHFKIIKSPHNGLSQLYQHSQVQHIRPQKFIYDELIEVLSNLQVLLAPSTLAAGGWDSWKPFLPVKTETKAALSILDFSKHCVTSTLAPVSSRPIFSLVFLLFMYL